MRAKRYILIIIIILLLTQIFRIYNFWVNFAFGRPFYFSYLVSGEEQKCQFKLNNFQFEIKNCLEYQSGSHIRLIGRVMDMTDKEFLVEKKINTKVKLVKKNNITSGLAWMVGVVSRIGRVRDRVGDKLMGFLPNENYSLLMDMPFGQIVKLPNDLYQQLKTIGMLHAVAASGYNVGLIVGAITLLSSRFWRFSEVPILVLGLLLYYCLTDQSVSILRAVLMFMLGLAAVVFGRTYHSLYLLATASVMILLWKPWFLFNLSFQLSIAATLGLITIGDDVLSFFKSRLISIVFFKTSMGHWFLETISLSLVAQLATLPLIIWYFKESTLLSVLSNVLLMWLAPLLTIGGLVWFLLGWLSLSLPAVDLLLKVFSTYFWLITEFFLRITTVLSNSILFEFKLKIDFISVFILYVAIFIYFVYKRRRAKKTTFVLDCFLGT